MVRYIPGKFGLEPGPESNLRRQFRRQRKKTNWVVVFSALTAAGIWASFIWGD